MASAGVELKVVKGSSTEEALRNRMCVAPDALPENVKHVSVKPRDANRRFAFTIERSSRVHAGQVAVNTAHRKWAELSLGESLTLVPMPGPFDAAGEITIEIDYLKKGTPMRFKGEEIERAFVSVFNGMILAVGQLVLFEYEPPRGSKVRFNVVVQRIHKMDEMALMAGRSASTAESIKVGICNAQSQIKVQAAPGADIMLTGGAAGSGAKRSIINPDWKFEDMGIGGLDEQFSTMFRRAFASRVMPIEIVEKLGIQHVKGILLYGPPGTGKTLMARKIGKMLDGREPKIVNGPEILSKFVGEAEANVRKLFEEAEAEYKAKGEMSDLHIIIFDEIDAICKTRGSVNNGTGVNDSVVNQLLSKIDGVESLNNILLIGMTNRPDMIDEALTRPGRLELKMQIGLPDEAGRRQIFVIHTKQMFENKMVADDVDLDELASLSKNFSGAEIAGVCRSAASFATNRCIKFEGSVEVKEDELASVKVERQDFLMAVEETIPAFGAATELLEECVGNGIVQWGEPVQRVLEDGELFVQQVRNSDRTPQVAILLAGPPGSGKTALAATLAQSSDFPLVKLISPSHMVGYSDFAKVAKINKVFEDAYKSTYSVIVVDELERLLDFVPIGMRFSNAVLQALLVLLRKKPPKGHKLLVIGTTSNQSVLDQMGLVDCFSKVMHVDTLTDGKQIMEVIREVAAFSEADVAIIEKALSHGERIALPGAEPKTHINIGVKKLYMLMEMARQVSDNQAEKFLESLDEECSMLI